MTNDHPTEEELKRFEAEARAMLDRAGARFVAAQNTANAELGTLRLVLDGRFQLERLEGAIAELVDVGGWLLTGVGGEFDPETAPAAVVEPPPPPTEVEINVEAIELEGSRDRVVRLVLPAGDKAVAVALPPDTAIALARVLVEQAKKAKSPAGLILPG